MKQLSLLLLLMILFCATASAEDETPQQGLQEIMKLYKIQDFETLIKERYAEIHKAESDAEVAKLIGMFEKRFASEQRVNAVLVAYGEAIAITPEIVNNPTPQITESNKMAIFNLESGAMKLYYMKTGKWGFHL